jgi:lambda family phage portal protein
VAFFDGLKQTLQSFYSAGATVSSQGYEGAATGRRLRNFRPTSADINTLLAAEGDELRARCRFLARNNAWARNAIDAWTSNAVGSGIVPVSKHPRKTVRRNLEQWWLRWTDECDAAGTTDFYGLQQQISNSTLEAGECFVRLRPRPNRDGLFVPLQLQVIESEHCPLDRNQIDENGNPVVCGIQFDRRGKRTFYWMYRNHPGAENLARLNPVDQDLVQVPADKVLHQFKPRRPGQIRGDPWLVPVIVQLYELDQYEDAELVRKKTAAMITHFIRVVTPQDAPTIGQDDDGDLGEDITQVVPGSVVYLKDNEDVTASQATDVGDMYSEFMKQNLYRIAAGIGVSFEMLTGNLSNVNYSSIRAGQLEVRRRIEQYQFQTLIYQFCRPVWVAFLEACVFGGLLDAKEYAANQSDYLDVEWRTPAWAWVDPLKDVQAKILEINNHITSRDAVIHERGEDPETVDSQIEQGIERSGYEPVAVAPGAAPAGAKPGAPAPAAKETTAPPASRSVQ